MDKENLSELFRLYGDDVFRLALSYLGSRSDAEDICQSVFLKLAGKNVSLYPGREKAWLLTCAANECRSLLRSFRRRNETELDETIPFPEPKDKELWDTVQSLPPAYRMVIHLYYYEGYDQGEISKILRISRTAVQTRMSRARAMLKKELNENE